MYKFTFPVGTDNGLTVTLANAYRESVTSFTGADKPFAELWPGGDLPILANLTATWIDPTKGTYQIRLAASDNANMDAGDYRLRSGVVTAEGSKIAAPDVQLTLIASPGIGVLPPLTDVKYNDLLVYAPWLTEQDSPKNIAGFVSECALARSWLIRILMMWYANWRERCLFHEGWYYDAPTIDQMQTYMNDGSSLVVSDRIKEIEARKAISIICQNELTPTDKPADNQYQDVGNRMENTANLLVSGLSVRVVNLAAGIDVTFDDQHLRNNNKQFMTL